MFYHIIPLKAYLLPLYNEAKKLKSHKDSDIMGFVASGSHLCGPGGRVKGEVWLPGGLV